MNFLLLKEIVVQLKQKMRCPKCRRRFSNRSIVVGNVTNQHVDAVLTCSKCKMQVFTNVSLLPANEVRKHRSIKVKANSFSTVTDNDVLDVKNFLRDFKGSFKSLFIKGTSNES